MWQFFPKIRKCITILCFIISSGPSIPRFYLFKGKTQLKNCINNCDLGICVDAHPNVRMTERMFMNWISHFVASMNGGVSLENRNLLIFNGHGTAFLYKMLRRKTIWALTCLLYQHTPLVCNHLMWVCLVHSGFSLGLRELQW